MDAIGSECGSERVVGKVNGHELVLTISPTVDEKEESKFRDINILGAGFLAQAHGVITINYTPGKEAVDIKFY